MLCFNPFWPLDLSNLITWISPFLVLAISGRYFHIYYILQRHSCKQAMLTLLIGSALRILTGSALFALYFKNGYLGPVVQN